VTLGDADFRKSLMKMIYRKFPKTASLPVTCHPFRTYGISLSEWDGEKLRLVYACGDLSLPRRTCSRSYYFVPTANKYLTRNLKGR
jgi:hypothetical protein